MVLLLTPSLCQLNGFYFSSVLVVFLLILVWVVTYSPSFSTTSSPNPYSSISMASQPLEASLPRVLPLPSWCSFSRIQVHLYFMLISFFFLLFGLLHQFESTQTLSYFFFCYLLAWIQFLIQVVLVLNLASFFPSDLLLFGFQWPFFGVGLLRCLWVWFTHIHIMPLEALRS